MKNKKRCSKSAVLDGLCMTHWRLANGIFGSELKRKMHPVGNGIGMENRYYEKCNKGGRR